MSIVKLKIKNFLSIADVEIKAGQINQIVGKNNQGKTSIIKAIEWAIVGDPNASLIRNGEDSAEVTVELGDSTTIKRRINAEGKQSITVSKDGFKAQSPQTLLDSLFETSSFNPLDLLDPKKRGDAILNSIDIKLDEKKLQEELNSSPYVSIQIPPLDFTQHGLKVIDQAHKYFYQRRAEANKDASDKKKRWETYEADLPKAEEIPVTRESVQVELDLVKQKQESAERDLLAITQKHEAVKQTWERLDKYLAEIQKIEADILSVTAAFEKNLAMLNARKEQGQKVVDQTKAEIPENMEDDTPYKENVQAIKIESEQVRAKFKDVEKFESVKKQREMVGQYKADFDQAQKVADELTVRVEALGGPIKKKLMASAEMPITGLEYKDGTFLVDGVSVDNLSSSKALQLALGVARKLAKKTKLICIDGAELLDEPTYVSLIEQIKDDGFVYFITRVGDPYHDDKAPYVEMSQGTVVQ